jgi:peptide/nickel transport system permease protein
MSQVGRVSVKAGAVRSESASQKAWRRFTRHKLAMVSLVMLSILVLLALFAPLIAPFDPAAIDTNKIYQPMSATHWMGTDALGRDTFSRVLHAGRVSLLVGLLVALLGTIIGVIIGLTAGYYSGQPLVLSVGPLSPRFRKLQLASGPTFWPINVLRWGVWAVIIWFVIQASGQYAATFDAGSAGQILSWVLGGGLAVFIGYFAFLNIIQIDIDQALSRIIDVMLSIPTIPVLLILAGLLSNPDVGLGPVLDQLFGPSRSIVLIIFVLTLFNWQSIARLVRGAVLSLRQQEFTDAARALGTSDGRIMFRHLLPNTIAPIIVQMTIEVGSAIVSEAGLSFLGFGIQEPTASWGNMLSGVREAIFQSPFIVFWPGFFILLTVLSINFIGDGLRDALDPRSKL